MDIRKFFTKKTTSKKRKRESSLESEGKEEQPIKRRRLVKRQNAADSIDSDGESPLASMAEVRSAIAETQTTDDAVDSKSDALSQPNADNSKAEDSQTKADDANEQWLGGEESEARRRALRKRIAELSASDCSRFKERFDSSVAYCPVSSAGFGADSALPYMALASAFSALSATRSRLSKISILCNLFRSVLALRPSELSSVVLLCVNEIAPAYAGIELGVGDSIILKALCQSTGRQLKDVKKELQRVGDLGQIAMNSRSKQTTMFAPKPLTVASVMSTLLRVAQTKGGKSQTEKCRLIQRLFVAAKLSEAQFIVRHLQGKLRIGVNEQTVVAALGRMCVFSETPLPAKGSAFGKRKLAELVATEEQCVAIVKRAAAEVPDLRKVVHCLVFESGIGALNAVCRLSPGVPIKVMLAKPTKGVAQILAKLTDAKAFTLEFKYDGERAQIHILADGSVRIFSRNAEDNSQKFPEIVAHFCEHRYEAQPVTEAILDSEVVAFDTVNERILPFQQLTTRKRKGVRKDEISVNVCIYAFDLLFLNGESLLRKPLCARRELMHSHFREVAAEFMFADFKDVRNSVESESDLVETAIGEYLDLSVASSCEGLMVKRLDGTGASYEPSRRSHNWLKCKKDYLEGVGDTLDLVVMGAFHGAGKRTGVFGSYLLGVLDEDSDAIQSVCKCATGFKDEDLAKLSAMLKAVVCESKPTEYETHMKAEVWFHAKYVFEVKCADLTLSPVHLGAVTLAHHCRGIGLRFPRFVRLREDKSAANCTLSTQLLEMYRSQTVIANNDDASNQRRFR